MIASSLRSRSVISPGKRGHQQGEDGCSQPLDGVDENQTGWVRVRESVGIDSLREAGDAAGEAKKSKASMGIIDVVAEAESQGMISPAGQKAAEAQAKKSALQRWRRKIWSFLEEPETMAASLFFQFRSVLYFTSAVLPLFGRSSVGQAAAVGEPLDDVLNSILLFEVALRLLVCPNILRFFSDPYHHFDCLACVPFIVRLACVGSTHSACVVTPGGFYSLIGFLRPILRMLKVTRHIGGFTLLSEVLRRSAEGLGVPVFLMCLLISFFAATIYWIEEEEQSFLSVPEVVWYCVVTISTVGYGDVSPTTPGGRLLGALLILTGLAAFAMPLGVISGNFSAVFEDKDEILLMRRVQRRLAHSGVGPEKIVDALQSIDVSGDGKLDYMEFSGLLLGLDVGFSEDNSRTLFDFFDSDKSGVLEYGEFLEKVFPGCEANSLVGPNPEAGGSAAAAAPAQGNVGLGDILRCVNDVQSRLQKMDLSLEQLSSSTESRLGALEMHVNKSQVGAPVSEKKAVPASSAKVGAGWLDGSQDGLYPQFCSPDGAASIPVELETAEEVVQLNEVQKFQLEEGGISPSTARTPPHSKPAPSTANPRAPSTPAPVLPGSLLDGSSLADVDIRSE